MRTDSFYASLPLEGKVARPQAETDEVFRCVPPRLSTDSLRPHIRVPVSLV